MTETKTDIQIAKLSGGVTNTNYVMQINGKKYVLRVAGKGTDTLIDRKNESLNLSQMSRLGIAPHIWFSDPDNGFQIQEFIDKDSLTAEKIRKSSELFRSCILLMRKYHTSGAVFFNRFDPVEKIQQELKVLEAAGYCHFYPNWEENNLFCQKIIQNYRLLNPPLCPCHNDTLAGNFMGDEDSLMLIDWEYSGTNDPYYDLACFSMENGLSEQEDLRMLNIYENTFLSPESVERFLYMKIITAFYWTIWSFLQIVNGKDADFYYPYGEKRYQTIIETKSKLNLCS